MLTQDDQERMRYKARMLAIRTQQILVEEVEERGMKKGMKQEVEQGMEKGEYIGRIHCAERLLKRTQTPGDDLVQLSLGES